MRLRTPRFTLCARANISIPTQQLKDGHIWQMVLVMLLIVELTHFLSREFSSAGLVHARVAFFLRSDHALKDIPALQIGVRECSLKNRMRLPLCDGNNTTTTEPSFYCSHCGGLRPTFERVDSNTRGTGESFPQLSECPEAPSQTACTSLVWVWGDTLLVSVRVRRRHDVLR